MVVIILCDVASPSLTFLVLRGSGCGGVTAVLAPTRGQEGARWKACSYSSNKPLRRQSVEQRLRLLQIERVEPFREPAVNRSEQFAATNSSASASASSGWRWTSVSPTELAVRFIDGGEINAPVATTRTIKRQSAA